MGNAKISELEAALAELQGRPDFDASVDITVSSVLEEQ
jgi:hypothetical protein